MTFAARGRPPPAVRPPTVRHAPRSMASVGPHHSSTILRRESFGGRLGGVGSTYATERLIRLGSNRFDILVMIATRFHPVDNSRSVGSERKGKLGMESHTSGTMAGSGSFRCQRCGYVLTLTSLDALRDCPDCGSHDFVRASLFNATPRTADTHSRQSAHAPREGVRRAREDLTEPGEYILYEDGDETKTVALTREWTRIGRSLAADVRFDDPTVSRRHALVVRQADGVRVLDDRSLNGVFVNGERVEWRALDDGDEILVGRYRLTFVCVTAETIERPPLDRAHSLG